MPEIVEFGSLKATDSPEDLTVFTYGGPGGRIQPGELTAAQRRQLADPSIQWCIVNCSPGVDVGYEVIRHRWLEIDGSTIQTKFAHEIVFRLFIPAVRPEAIVRPIKAEGADENDEGRPQLGFGTCWACDPAKSNSRCPDDQTPYCDNNTCKCH